MAENTTLNGWGRATWNSGPWNGPGVVSITGVSAATAVGTAVASLPITISITGVSAATAVGSPTASAGIICTPSGVSAATEVGSPTAGISMTVTPDGVQASTAVGVALIWQEIIPGQSANWIQIAA